MHQSSSNTALNYHYVVRRCHEDERASFRPDCIMFKAVALDRHFNLQKIHFYYANWSFNSNCILSLISILKKDNVCSGFSEILAQNSFLFATRQFLWETQSPKFENLHFHLQKRFWQVWKKTSCSLPRKKWLQWKKRKFQAGEWEYKKQCLWGRKLNKDTLPWGQGWSL